jgi:antitoxin ParD1/3/4
LAILAKEAAMVTMNVSLTPEMKSWVEEAVASGRFASASDYVRHLLRLERERSENMGYTLAELRAEIQKGIDSPSSGVTLDEIFAEARARYNQTVE